MKGGKYATIKSSGIDKTAMISHQTIHNFIQTYEKGNKICSSYQNVKILKALVLEYEELRDVKIRITELQCLLVDQNAQLIDSEETDVLDPLKGEYGEPLVYDNYLTLLFSDRGSKLIYMMLYENKELFPEPEIMRYLYVQIQTSSMSAEGIRATFNKRLLNDILHGLFFTYDVIDIFTFVVQQGYPDHQIYEFLDLVSRIINEILELKDIDYSCNIIIYISKIKKIIEDGKKKDPPVPYSIETDPMFTRVLSINH
jgi:hypothetical protein